MLRVPAVRRIGDVTVYQDDTVWFRFYLVPPRPSIQVDNNGKPVFLLSTYGASAQDRAANPDLPRGGGFMNFDVQFSLSQTEIETSKTELQTWVTDEYQRRKPHPDYKNLPDYQAAAAPQVEIADPLLSDGTVTMLTTQSADLTNDRFAEAPASLVAGSGAVFNVDLNARGAAFMRDLMVTSSGDGSIDLTPIQVIYDLKMWARLPPVKITVEADSERVHNTILELSQNNRDNACTPKEIETYRETGVNSSTLKETGAVSVKLDKGDAQLPEEAFQALQDYALDLFDTMIQERFLSPAEEDDETLEFDSDDPAIEGNQSRVSGVLFSSANFRGTPNEIGEDQSSLHVPGNRNTKRSLRVTRGHRVTLYQNNNFSGKSRQFSSSVSILKGVWRSARVWQPPTARYKVSKTINTSTMKLKIELDRSQVVEWPVGGQATLQTFFSGMSKDEIGRHVRHVEATFFDSLNVEVRAMVDFKGGPFQAAEVQCKYEARDENGDNQEFNDSYTFLEGQTAAQLFDPRIIGDEQEYNFRYRLILDDGSKTDFTIWETTSNRALNISVSDPRRLSINVSAASLNWDIVRAVSATLSHGEGQTQVQQSFELSKIQPTANFDKRMLGDPSGDVVAKLTYILTDGKVIEADPTSIPTTNTLFVVPNQQVDILNVSLLPSGDWSEVVQVVVQLEYARADGRVYDRTFLLKKIEDFVEWQVLLDDPTRRAFRYQQLVTYRNGDEERFDWVEKSGDQAILIKVKGVKKQVVSLLPPMLDFAQTPAVTVSIDYDGEPHSFTFTSAEPQQFQAPLSASGDRHYTYQIVWHLASGESESFGPERSKSPHLLIPKPKLSQQGFLDIKIRGFAVDFSVTPFVDVELVWTDDTGHEEHSNISLDETTKNGSWKVAIADVSQRSYQYKVTYNLANGERVEGANGVTDDPVISITALQS